MKRFSFLKFLGISAAAVVVAPLIPAAPLIETTTVYSGELGPVVLTEETLRHSQALINSNTFFRAQSKVLERVYMKSTANAPYRSDNVANFGAVFENMKYRDG